MPGTQFHGGLAFPVFDVEGDGLQRLFLFIVTVEVDVRDFGHVAQPKQVEGVGDGEVVGDHSRQGPEKDIAPGRSVVEVSAMQGGVEEIADGNGKGQQGNDPEQRYQDPDEPLPQVLLSSVVNHQRPVEPQLAQLLRHFDADQEE